MLPLREHDRSRRRKFVQAEQIRQDDTTGAGQERIPVKLRISPDVEPVGSGRFGTVVKVKLLSVKWRKCNGEVGNECSDLTQTCPSPLAVKLVRTKSRTKGRSNREASIISSLRHPNVVRLFFLSFDHSMLNEMRADEEGNSSSMLSMFFEWMPTNLFEHLRGRGPLTFDETLQYSRQLFAGLRYLRDMRICHRDIKPSNILLDPNKTRVKICDFGCARVLPDEEEKMLPYMCSRYYRAPELILGSESYECEVDWWSASCVVAEMTTAAPLFCGETSIDQLVEIVELLGDPSEDELRDMRVKKESHARQSFRSIRHFKTLAERLRLKLATEVPETISNMILASICFSPKKRTIDFN